MLKIRKRLLPEGWYPDSSAEIRRLISEWVPEHREGKSVAAVAPHAGWTFCGSMIAQAVASLEAGIDTIAVIGGHDPPGGPFISYREDRWDTPTGQFFRDKQLAELVEENFAEEFMAEEFRDNTVEVVFTMAAALNPGVKWVAWRVPSDSRSVQFGEQLANCARNLARKVAVIGSTDLTHYGPQYGFAPSESRANPVKWAEEKDRDFADHLLSLDAENALNAAHLNKSACSAGGAVAAMSFARSLGFSNGRLLDYRSSRDIYPGDSFVGYAALTWE